MNSVQIRSIWTEYREIRRISPYSVRIRENTYQKKLRIWTLFTQWLRMLYTFFFALNTYIILLTFIQFILIQFIIKQNSNKVIEVNVCLVWQLSIHFWLLGRWWTYVVYKMYVGGWEDLFKKFFDKWENNSTSFQLLDAYAPWNKGCRIGINFCKQKQNYL